MKKNTLSLLALLLILSLLNTSCSLIGGCTEAIGEKITQEITLDKFTEIKVSSATKVSLTQGNTQKVEIKASQNIIDLLNKKVNSNQWEISFNKCIESFNGVEILITIPKIKELRIDGSGSITSKGLIVANTLKLSIQGSGKMNLDLEVKELESEISGSGDLTLSGTTKIHDIEINGSGDINAYELKCDEAEVEINGSGDVKIAASYSLEVEVNGSGDVYYTGDVKKINSEINGSGKLKQAE